MYIIIINNGRIEAILKQLLAMWMDNGQGSLRASCTGRQGSWATTPRRLTTLTVTRRLTTLTLTWRLTTLTLT